MKRLLQRRWKPIVWIALVGLISGLVFSWVVGSRLCAAANQAVPVPHDLPVEPVRFASASGTTIHGWLIATTTNRGVVILQHGVRSTRASMLGHARFLLAAGYAVLLFDFQAHGESTGKHITFGHLESRDSQAAVAFSRQRFPDRPVAVLGMSLGGAAALLADPPLDVQALVVESAFPTIVDATKDRLERLLGRPARLLSPLLTSQLNFRLGVSANGLRPIDHVANIRIPKLFLAGTADPRTKLAEAHALFTCAAEPKEFYPAIGAGHESLHHFLGNRYEQLILDFLDKHVR